MSIDVLNNYCEITILVACLCVGYILKKWIKDVDNKFIPTICMTLGIVLCVGINWGHVDLVVVVTGAVSGLASTGVHQVFKRFVENRNGSESGQGIAK